MSQTDEIEARQARIARAQQIEAKTNDDLRRQLLRSDAVPTTGDPGTLAPTGTAAPSGFAACRDAHEKLGGHLEAAASALKRAKRTLHADHPARPIITEASDQLQSAQDQHAAIGEALEL